MEVSVNDIDHVQDRCDGQGDVNLSTNVQERMNNLCLVIAYLKLKSFGDTFIIWRISRTHNVSQECNLESVLRFLKELSTVWHFMEVDFNVEHAYM